MQIDLKELNSRDYSYVQIHTDLRAHTIFVGFDDEPSEDIKQGLHQLKLAEIGIEVRYEIQKGYNCPYAFCIDCPGINTVQLSDRIAEALKREGFYVA